MCCCLLYAWQVVQRLLLRVLGLGLRVERPLLTKLMVEGHAAAVESKKRKVKNLKRRYLAALNRLCGEYSMTYYVWTDVRHHGGAGAVPHVTGEWAAIMLTWLPLTLWCRADRG